MRARWLWLGLLMACGVEFEGDEAGECSDGADNDRDRLFDCLDPDCVGSPVCLGTTDTDEPVVRDPDPSDDTPDEDVDTDIDCGERCPGPHPEEAQLVSAWQQFPDTVDSTYGSGCTSLGNPDWDDVFDPPTYEGTYVYVFYRVQSNLTAAKGQRCPNQGQRGFPETCVDTSVVYTLDGHTWTGTLPDEDVQVDAGIGGGCTVVLGITAEVLDDGDVGTLTNTVTITAPPSCPGDIRANNGCTFSHAYDLTWVRAE